MANTAESTLDQLDRIFAEGTVVASQPYETYADRMAAKPSNNLVCADGFTLSAVAGYGAYCSPRPHSPWGTDGVTEDYEGPYFAVEVGFPSAQPEPWDQWSEWCESPDSPTDTVYGYVPAEAVRALVALHGGLSSITTTEVK